MKLIYIVIDGMGDLPIEELGGKTPLEFAHTPNMDFLASRGKLGLMYTVGRGIAPESNVAAASILGYDPYKYIIERGPLEAIGAGIKMRDGDLALRCNFATLGPNRLIIDRRVKRSLTTEEASELAEAINKQVKLESHPAEFKFKSTVDYRSVLVIRSKTIPLSSRISNTDPVYERVDGIEVMKVVEKTYIRDSIPLEDSEAAKASANLVNEFTWKSHRVLEDHEVNRRREAEGKLKANILLARDPGTTLPKLFNISERYGVRFACLADMPVEKGIAKLAGMSVLRLPPPSKDIARDYTIRSEKLLEVLDEFDCFFIHIKGPDEPGHDGNFVLKAEIIATIDEHFFGRILPEIRLDDTVICVTADHSTPCKVKAHTDDPVPLMISGGKIRSDGLKKFSERECRKGSLGILERGTMLMPMLMEAMGAKSLLTAER